MGEVDREAALRRAPAPGLRAGAVALLAASCVPMLVMLPAGLTGLLSSVGVRADAGWVQALAHPFEPVAQPLLIVSAVLLAAGALLCGWSPLVTALAGGVLLSVGMYVVTAQAGQTQPVLFYAGLALFAASPALSILRPRLRACRPLLPRRRARRILLAALGASAVLLASAGATGWGRATAVLHAAHARGPEGRLPARPDVRVAQDAFSWSGRVERYTAENAWFPPFSSDGVLLRVRGRVSAGALHVQLMDGRAAIVFEETLTAIPGAGLEVRAAGARGVWMVTLRFRDYSGDLRVEMKPLLSP